MAQVAEASRYDVSYIEHMETMRALQDGGDATPSDGNATEPTDSSGGLGGLFSFGNLVPVGNDTAVPDPRVNETEDDNVTTLTNATEVDDNSTNVTEVAATTPAPTFLDYNNVADQYLRYLHAEYETWTELINLFVANDILFFVSERAAVNKYRHGSSNVVRRPYQTTDQRDLETDIMIPRVLRDKTARLLQNVSMTATSRLKFRCGNWSHPSAVIFVESKL